MPQLETLSLGLDIGSTTVKAVVLDKDNKILFSRYTRHMSDVRQTVVAILRELETELPGKTYSIAATGSGAMSVASELKLHFVQEVVASGLSIQKLVPDTDVMIELGGEDAKLTFFTGGVDLRMNETCAGGTGAFIDQMASFLNMEITELDQKALNYKHIYPIASRCGVFAKTDIVPLINEGCSKNDIAMSIMQAVVNQFIGGLARGRAIKGKVVFLGGPLAFLKSLQKCFIDTLKLGEGKAVFPENAQYYVALGAAFFAQQNNEQTNTLPHIIEALQNMAEDSNTQNLPPLFNNEEEYNEFYKRHNSETVEKFPIEEYEGPAWLGIDSGSTTIKAALIDDKNRLLYSYYGPNKGDPLKLGIEILKEIYSRKKDGLNIVAATATGYGSALLKAALKLDVDEVETVAHSTAAQFFAPNVSFILDIGGQDIKCMRIRDGIIERIQLNEACSAGCGSFIENFASSLNIPLDKFVEAALQAKNPVDLGTRCTVFMNSKVKQAQKDGLPMGDIAAGLSYSVIRNAAYKVIKINNVEELGECVVAQGGSFINDALLRALENQIGKPVVRPNLSGLMGAFGGALIAKKRGPEDGEKTKLISSQDINNLSLKTANARCTQCTNSCMLTITTFSDNRRFVSGNRCEKGAGMAANNLINLYAYKYKRIFEPYVPIEKEKARRGTIGIPRALNIYENYPLWFTLLSSLGYRVELSEASSKNLFFKGYNSIPSQTVCYPAKMTHGHIMDLIDKEVDYIFFPCIPREQKDFKTQKDHYNCPVVIGYPELIAKNINELEEKNIPFIAPFLPLDREILAKRLSQVPMFSDIPIRKLEAAVRRGFRAMDKFKSDIQKEGEKAITELTQSGAYGVVLAGHPYHIDPAINHGIPELINSCGLAVLTEDSVAHLMPDPGPLRVVDQWTYHSRLYRAGAYVGGTDNLAVLQLVSFGCGLDAITSDQLEEIVTVKGKLYSQIKIDEGANLGPAKIRIRSLLAALKDIATKQKVDAPADSFQQDPPFTEDMKDTHTILVPQLSPIHFQFIETVLSTDGYKIEHLPRVNKHAVEMGLRYVNNDACFPAIVVVGQLLQAVKSGKYDTNKIALMISQTGGGCRATNYIAFLRKALKDCGMSHIPILTLNVGGQGQNSGFKVSFRMLKRGLMAGFYGDALMRVLHRVKPYELEEGSVDKLVKEWSEKGQKAIATGGILRYHINMFRMIKAFDKLPLKDIPRKPRVGLVGEILLKYHPDANNQAAQVVENEGGEAVVTDLMDFVLYSFYDHVYNYKHLAGSWMGYFLGKLGIYFLEFGRWSMRLGFKFSKRFTPPILFSELRKKTHGIISLGHQTGEGWLLAAEMIELLESGVNNILCMQPFGCLPNHITGKGVIKEIKNHFPNANIMAVDYDSGASEVNQINRIKLMMSIAKQK
ncbi:putative CoA-substrate-specific enzyme activase [Elusimicrobium posterum]|uniref:acyl-CoA dehydratase activase-related protein n=1 Tax=Elusimicrobium posterum TaxID=3116653 RepID=UPI003C781485